MSGILVVDDEQDIIELLFKSLSRHGYNVETAATGEEAIERAQKNNFDIVLLDNNLPGIKGIKVLKEIKKISPETEIIMITGQSSIESAVESLKNGASDYIQKPINSDKIMILLEKTFEKRKLTETVALYEISKAIFSTIEMNELVKIIVDSAMKVLSADNASIMLFNESKELYIAFASGLNNEAAKETPLSQQDGFSGWIAENKQPLILIKDGLLTDARFKGLQSRENIKSSIIIPLLKSNVILGILSVNRLNIHENFSPADLYKSNIFASLASLSLDNANLFKNVRELQINLAQANTTLENKEKTALLMLSELKETHEKLKINQQQLAQSAKLAALGKLVSDMAHEVNNPLMIISATAQIGLIDKLPDERITENLKTIVSECRKSKDIIQRLLKFSRPSRGQLKEKNINNSIEAIVKIVEHQFNLSGVNIKRNYCQNIASLLIDEEQLQEVFMNLLNNAKDAMEKNGEITIRTTCADNFIRIDFSDTGCGMPEEAIKHIFEPFFTTKEKGNGLGLPICYGIVKAHQGELKFESKVGLGTTASILLPLKEKTNV